MQFKRKIFLIFSRKEGISGNNSSIWYISYLFLNAEFLYTMILAVLLNNFHKLCLIYDVVVFICTVAYLNNVITDYWSFTQPYFYPVTV